MRAVTPADTYLVLGLQAVRAGVSELSAAFALSIDMGARLEDIAGTIHAREAAAKGFGKRFAYLSRSRSEC
ncbi:pyruvate/2-oxoglutarate dehydrogenase complex dihydrolipoamide dehydrogenase (E3) component [Rhizobium leguminosarum]|nr:pyruvate/2-oxoglutarate dehydrogenase complex dihydrolipoamide dehydrogenase (E3) component [Rhizobium leguminosarum]